MKNIINRMMSDKKPIYKNLVFCFYLLKRSISFWVTFSFYIFSLPISIIVFSSINKINILNYSFLIIIINITFMVTFLFMSILKLFTEPKYSSVDIFLVSKPFKKFHIFCSRFLIIFLFVTVASFIQFIITTILIFSLNLNINWVTFYFISLVFINPFFSIFVISLFILFSIVFKRIWFALISLLMIFSISALPIFTRSFNNTKEIIQYNTSSYNSFEKLTYFNENNEIKSYIVLKINYNSNESKNKNIFKEINKDNVYDYFIPGEWIGSLYSSLEKNLFSISSDDYNINHNFSLVKNSFTNSNVININTNNLLVLRPNDINPFDLQNNYYEDLIINKIKSINYINLKDDLLVKSILDKISQNENWNILNLNQKEINTLKSLIGIFEEQNELYYYWKYYEILKLKTPNLETKIRSQFNENLWNLMFFIWTSEITRDNVEIIKYFGDINKIYPSALTINYNEPINKNELNFIKNKLIKFNDDKPFYLDSNNSYISTSIDQLQKLSSKIIDKMSWINFVLDNTLTYENTLNFLAKLKEIFPNIYQFKLNNNYFNPYQYSLYLTKYSNTYLNHSNILITTIIFVVIGVGWLSWHKFNKMNYKNIEM
ncbi:ABC transporter permease [Mesomycoplasma moatsii]|uniref:ABC transporter permease n=2 Tax=Mesomycoplasma moatsii TaxID=171287 RepID=UPI0003B55875